jgi:amidase
MENFTRNLLKWGSIVVGVAVIAKAVQRIRKYRKMPWLQEQIFHHPTTPCPVEGKFIFKPASVLAEMIRNGIATSEEVVQEHINHIKNQNWKTNALVWLFEEDALEAARQADQKRAAGEATGLLFGVPVTVKEHYWVAGKPSNCNTLRYAAFKAPRNAALVENLLSEGAIIIGTTNVPEMVLDYQTQGKIYPTASNPYDLTRTPGGSTGGGAAAVASGFSTAELGSDTIGSVRVPAAFCGLYALKPTEKTISLFDGGWPAPIDHYLFREMAMPGPLTRTIDDLEIMWNVLRKGSEYNQMLDAVEPANKLTDYRIAWIDDWQDKIYIGKDVKQKLDHLVTNLATQGVAPVKDAPDLFVEMTNMALIMASYSWFFDRNWIARKFTKAGIKLLKSHRINYPDSLKILKVKNEKNYNKVLERRQKLINKTEEFFKEFDFLITPVTSGAAIVKGPIAYKIPVDGLKMPYWDYFAYGQVVNATGHPAISIPLGLNTLGLPIGIQVVGRYYSEKDLLQFARLIQPLHDGYIKPIAITNEYTLNPYEAGMAVVS